MPRKSKPILPRVIHVAKDGKSRLVETPIIFIAETRCEDTLGKEYWHAIGCAEKCSNGVPEDASDDTAVLELVYDFFLVHAKPLPKEDE